MYHRAIVHPVTPCYCNVIPHQHASFDFFQQRPNDTKQLVRTVRVVDSRSQRIDVLRLASRLGARHRARQLRLAVRNLAGRHVLWTHHDAQEVGLARHDHARGGREGGRRRRLFRIVVDVVVDVCGGGGGGRDRAMMRDASVRDARGEPPQTRLLREAPARRGVRASRHGGTRERVRGHVVRGARRRTRPRGVLRCEAHETRNDRRGVRGRARCAPSERAPQKLPRALSAEPLAHVPATRTPTDPETRARK